MKVKILPAVLNGKVNIPPSKSYAHRAIICASLAKGTTVINNVVLSKDILATISVMEKLGVSFEYHNNQLTVTSNTLQVRDHNLFCSDSGSTLRFIIPIALTTNEQFIFDGNSSLQTRPIWPYFKVFDNSNITYEYKEKLPLKTSGSLKSGTYQLVGNVSSQFFTGLCFGLSLLDSKSIINVEGTLQSRSYIDITLDVMKSFGVKVINNNYESFEIYPSTYKPTNYNVEGDFSQLAFYALAGVIGNEVTVDKLNFNSVQGDKQLLTILDKLQIAYTTNQTAITFRNSRAVNTTIDISECPDLGPVVFCLGALGKGTMIVTGIERLRIKESDRVATMVTELTKLGAKITDCDSYVQIEGVDLLNGGCEVQTYDDHRVAMCLSMLGSITKAPVVINNANVVDKSYPNFYDDFTAINGQIKILP